MIIGGSALEQRIERLGIAGEIAADEIGRGRAVVHQLMWNGNRPAVGDIDHVGVGGSARMPAPLDMTWGSRMGEHDDLAGLERDRFPADQAGEAAALR